MTIMHRLRAVQLAMNSSVVYELIAGIALIITGFVLRYDELWGALMILLGLLLLILWLGRQDGSDILTPPSAFFFLGEVWQSH